MPAFYHGPQTIMDLIHQSVGKALDMFDIENNLFHRWSGKMDKTPARFASTLRN
jgi:4-hydroxy-3-polyprenylbenzoate decarboxylase